MKSLCKGSSDDENQKNLSVFIWKLLSTDKNSKISVCDIYNLLMIFIGTENFHEEITKELLNEFIRKSNKHNLNKEIENISAKIKEIFNSQNISANLRSDNKELDSTNNRIQEMISRLSANHLPKFTINLEELKNREFDECTYHPEVHNIPKTIYNTVMNPKDYIKAINRIKSVNEEKQRKKVAEINEFKEINTRLERLKQMKINPPRCLSRSKSRKKLDKKVLFYVDIEITHGKYLI